MYDSEDLKIINNLLKECNVIKDNNIIYYTPYNKNEISRLIKINKILNVNISIKLNIYKLKYDDIYIIIDLYNNTIDINYYKVMVLIIKYNFSPQYTLKIINNILSDMYNYKNFKIQYYDYIELVNRIESKNKIY